MTKAAMTKAAMTKAVMPRPREARRWIRTAGAGQGPPTVFLVLRRMRVPLIVLITIFAVSVLGLTLVPGQDAAGRPAHLGIFDAF
jgi:hypothetical protein